MNAAEKTAPDETVTGDMYLPREIVLGEVAKWAGSAGRRGLALTCRSFLRALPHACPRKIARAENVQYKLIALGFGFDLITGGLGEELSTDEMLASARRGRFPAAYLSRISYPIRMTLTNTFFQKFLEIAHRRGSRTLIHLAWSFNRDYSTVWPCLAILRGHHWICEDVKMFGKQFTSGDFKYLTQPAVFDHMLAHVPTIFLQPGAMTHVSANMTCVDVRAVFTTYGSRVCISDVIRGAAQHAKWDTLEFALGYDPSEENIMTAGLHGGYEYLLGNCEGLRHVRFAKWISHPQFQNASVHLQKQLFRAECDFVGFTATVAVSSGHCRLYLGEWIDECVREEITVRVAMGVACVLPANIHYKRAKPLIIAGALPAPNDAVQQGIYAEVQHARGKVLTYQDVTVLFRGILSAEKQEELVGSVKSMVAAGMIPTTSERKVLVKCAYDADNLELLLAVLGGSLKYPHTAGSALSATSRIRTWRLANGLPCK